MTIFKSLHTIYNEKEKLMEIEEMIKAMDQGILLLKNEKVAFKNEEFEEFA
jgi:signal transduction histidine kinase